VSCKKYKTQYLGPIDPNNPNSGVPATKMDFLFIRNNSLWVSDFRFKKIRQISPENVTVTLAAFNDNRDRIAYKTSGGTIYISQDDGTLLDSISSQSTIISMDWQKNTSILYKMSAFGEITFWGGTIPLSTQDVMAIIPSDCTPVFLQITEDNKLVIQYYRMSDQQNYMGYMLSGNFYPKNLGIDGIDLASFKALGNSWGINFYVTYHFGGSWSYYEYDAEFLSQNLYLKSTNSYQMAKRLWDGQRVRVTTSLPPYLESYTYDGISLGYYSLSNGDEISNLELD
jgi:hypothetical protein